MSEQSIKISVELPAEEALAFAQFLKRAGHSDYLRFTVGGRDNEEAFLMLYAAGQTSKFAR